MDTSKERTQQAKRRPGREFIFEVTVFQSSYNVLPDFSSIFRYLLSSENNLVELKSGIGHGIGSRPERFRYSELRFKM